MAHPSSNKVAHTPESMLSLFLKINTGNKPKKSNARLSLGGINFRASSKIY